MSTDPSNPSTPSALPAVDNPPGLDALAYRVGTHAQFKADMVAALANGPLKALAGADDDDPSRALIDAWAATLDVLAFYQERIANEGFLRTLTEERSAQELGRAVGFALNPGIAAETYVAFTLDDTPGAPEKLTIDAATRLQSVPGPGEQAQVFETVEKIEARPAWNTLRPRLVQPPTLAGTTLYLRGIATQLQRGDAMLIVSQTDPTKRDFHIVTDVTPQPESGRTLVTLDSELADFSQIQTQDLTLFALRQRGALFGHNAPDANVIAATMTSGKAALFTPGDSGKCQWIGYDDPDYPYIDLDAAYPKIVAGSWLVLIMPDTAGMPVKVGEVSFPSRAQFGLSSRITRISPDPTTPSPDLSSSRDKTAVCAQSEPLTLAEPPYTDRSKTDPAEDIPLDEATLAPIEGAQIPLDSPLTNMPAGRTLIVTGKRIRAKVITDALTLRGTDQTGAASTRVFQPDDTLMVASPPQMSSLGNFNWELQTADGFTGTLTAGSGLLKLTAALATDPEISERVNGQAAGDDPTLLRLGGAGLANIYDRPTVRILANVARATHGETRTEVLGSADAAQAFQAFPLRQAPLTFVPAATATGGMSTLQVRMNGILWDEAPALYGAGPRDRVFTATQGADGKFVVQFGDGATGARPPRGDENVSATYRVGLGAAGNVGAGQVRVLQSRVLGVRGATNPMPAAGGVDAEHADEARLNVPFRVLTLDRIVTLRDYEDFARAFGGVGKARATWQWVQAGSQICVTVVDSHGHALDTGPLQRLEAAMAKAHDPAQTFTLATAEAARFSLHAQVILDPHWHADVVLNQATLALRRAFDLTRREFGQAVTESEILGLLQSVDGVVAAGVNVTVTQPPPGAGFKNTWETDHHLPAEAPGLWLLAESLADIVQEPVASLGEADSPGGSA